jgi:hypothetical protein
MGLVVGVSYSTLEKGDFESHLVIGVVLLLLGFPAVQFAAAVLALLETAVFVPKRLRGPYTQSLLRILGGIIGGTLAGLLVMAAIGLALSVL